MNNIKLHEVLSPSEIKRFIYCDKITYNIKMYVRDLTLSQFNDLSIYVLSPNGNDIKILYKDFKKFVLRTTQLIKQK